MARGNRLKPGQSLNEAVHHADYNGLLDLLDNQAIPSSRGVSAAGIVAGASKTVPQRLVTQAYCAEAVPAYSVFGVSSQEPPVGRGRTRVSKCGGTGAGSPFMLWTNGAYAGPANGYVNCWPLDWGPCRLTVDASSDTPTAGQLLGFVPGSFTVSTKFAGILACSDVDIDDLVWGISATATAFLGRANGAIASFASGALGTGNVDILFRPDGTALTLAEANTPLDETSPWTIAVVNPGEAIADDTLVLCVATPGVGVVVQPFTASNYIALTPAGGIPKRVGTAITVVNCAAWGVNTTSNLIYSLGFTVPTINMAANEDIPAATYIQVIPMAGGVYSAIWQECPA